VVTSMFFKICAALLSPMTLTFLLVAQASAEMTIRMTHIIVTSYAGAEVVGQTRTSPTGNSSSRIWRPELTRSRSTGRA